MGTREDLNNMPALEERNSKEMFSIIRNREDLPQPSLGTNRYQESSDEFYGIVSDSDIVNNERYRNDAKLRKRCAVVITPTKELIQYERKRDQMYNEILLKQRRKLEMRALEKQREKERRRLERREEMAEQTITLEKGVTSAAIQRDRDKKLRRKSRSYTEVFMSSESEFETNFQVRTRRQTKQNVKDLQQPLNIQIDMTEASTNSLLSQIDAHLEEPRKPKTLEQPKVNVEKELPNDEDIKKKTCDITNDKGQTKMREHNNLLADIVQHLSPYQLDLPETNKTTPATEATLTDSAKEKVTVTEHIILQQSFDNLLEKTPTPQTQLANNEQQQMATTPPPTPSYAHEPKLNTAANFNSSPSADEMPQQENNTPLKKNNENSTLDSNKESKQIDETLEQILEESISVFKSVTSPGNLLNENTKARTPNPPPQTANSATTFPIIISNVKSLNNLEQSDKLLDKTEHLLNKETETCGSDDVLKTQIKEKAKEQIQAPTTAPTLLSSTILSNAETSLLAADGGDLSNISSETEIVQALKVPSLMAADLSDISLESEISKHLPDIAEPSPVVTDMSDNSNESQAFNHLHNPSTTMAAVMSLPDLPLEMPLATTNLPANPSETLDSNFQHQFSTTLNTPTKLASIANNQNAQTVNDLNTPLKFPLPTDLENSEQTPLKSVLEPETDNNVTKFLDLILNKTVTDAESETRDKIIKELNALTADSTGTGTTEATNECCDANNELTKVTELTEDITANAGNNKSLDIETAVEMDNQTLELPKTLEAQEEKQQQQQVKENLETLKTLENSQESSGLKANEEQTETPTPSANNDEELNPPKETAKAEPPNPMKNKSTTTPQKQTFNIKCRVRLKRLNIDEHQHCKSSNKETWMAIPLTKPEETDKSANNIDMKNCDNTATISKIDITTSSSLIKKPCLKYNSSKRASEEEEEEQQPNKTLETTATEEVPLVAKKAKLEKQVNTNLETTTTNVVTTPEQKTPSSVVPSTLSAVSLTNSKIKTKPLKTVTFDLSNLNEELRDSTSSSTSTSSSSYHNSSKHKTKNHQALGCYLKSNHRAPKKLPDNTLRAAETLQLFVNTINDSTRTPPPAEFNKKRSPIKNKCIAEDETPRPPPASTLMGTPPCKKSCTDKARSQISSTKCKDQLVSSLPAPSISTITSDITTARIYTSSPLDQTLPEYDDNVDTVADTELILPTTTGSLRRKLKRPKKSLTRPEPTDDTSTDDISNQPECNGEDDTDAVVDNEDDVFVEELLPIPAANEHILEEIVSARPTHMGTGTVIRDDYMNIEATATVPVYLFNDESRDLATPEPIQSSGDTTNVVDSSSYLNNSSSPAAHNVMATATASTTSTSSSSAALGNLEKSMLSPSEHEVSSTQETFYQTPTKSKQNGGESFGDKSSSTTTKDKGGGGVGGSSSCSMMGGQKLKSDELNFQNKQQEDDQTSSTTGLLQNNQVDTTNHSPEMCTLTLTPTTTTTSTTTSMTSNNRKMRKVSTHDEILFNELQQQQQQQQQIQQAATTKRKNLTTTTTFCAESTSDNNCKTKVINNNPLDMGVKSNGALNKEDKFKKLLKEVCKRDKNLTGNELEVVSGGVGGLIQGSNTIAAGGGGGGGSSPSTTTIINEDKISRSKRKKQKSSKSSKSKTHNERCTKIVLKASKLSAHVPTTTNPLIITIPKSRILIPPPTPSPPPPTEGEKQQMEEFIDIPNAKLFTEKEKDNTMLGQSSNHQQHHHLSPSKPAQTLNSIGKKEWHQSSPTAPTTKSKRSHSPVNNTNESANIKTSNVNVNESKEVIRSSTSNKETKEKSAGSSTTKNSLNEIKTNNIVGKEKLSGSTTAIKKKTKTSSSSHSSSSSKSNNTINNHNNSSGDIKELVFVKDKYDLIKSKEKSHYNNSDLQENKEKLKEKTTSQQTKTSTKDKIKEKHKNEKSNNIKYDISLPSSNKNSSSTHSSASSNKTSNSRSSKSSSSNFSSSSSTSSTNLSANNTILKSKTNLSTHASAQANTQNNAAAASMLTTPTSSTSNTALVGGGSVTISTHHVRKKLKTK